MRNSANIHTAESPSITRPILLSSVLVVVIVLGQFLVPYQCTHATPSKLPEIVARRGKSFGGTGTVKPTVTLTEPTGGWTSSQMLSVAGSCSDPTIDPVVAAINGVRYFIRVNDGAFSRKFPASRGENTVRVECSNAAGVATETRTITGVMNPVRLKVVLTSDTDGVYTDLHIYESDGRHVYWADTNSPSGGLFFLNQQGDSFDQPGYGPYLYVHPAPNVGVVRIDTNYWPGGAVQHTLASLDIVVDEGMPTEFRKRVRKPLARPGETQTLAYVVVRPNGIPMKVFVPGQDDPKETPLEVLEYQKSIEPKIASASESDEYAFIHPSEESRVRDSVVTVALAQAKKLSPMWIPEQRDCAGLVRFAYREAIAPRTQNQQKYLPKGVHLPVLSFIPRQLVSTYPNVWQVGIERDGTSKVGAFADAETLIGYNFRKKGRNALDARPGDLFAFRQETEKGEQYHLMIFGGPTLERGVVVYHTGNEPERLSRRPGYSTKKGDVQVRVVSASTLFSSADPIWSPVKENPYFLGVFEWNHFNPKNRDATFAQLL